MCFTRYSPLSWKKRQTFSILSALNGQNKAWGQTSSVFTDKRTIWKSSTTICSWFFFWLTWEPNKARFSLLLSSLITVDTQIMFLVRSVSMWIWKSGHVTLPVPNINKVIGIIYCHLMNINGLENTISEQRNFIWMRRQNILQHVSFTVSSLKGDLTHIPNKYDLDCLLKNLTNTCLPHWRAYAFYTHKCMYAHILYINIISGLQVSKGNLKRESFQYLKGQCLCDYAFPSRKSKGDYIFWGQQCHLTNIIS